MPDYYYQIYYVSNNIKKYEVSNSISNSILIIYQIWSKEKLYNT